MKINPRSIVTLAYRGGRNTQITGIDWCIHKRKYYASNLLLACTGLNNLN